MKNRLQYKIKLVAILICVIALCSQSVVKAQIIVPDEHKGELIIQQTDTRSLSLGSATVSDVFGRASIGVNPALSGLYVDNLVFQFSTNYNLSTSLMQYSLTTPTVSSKNSHFTARFGFLSNGHNDLTSSENWVPDVTVMHTELAYALNFNDVFSLGVHQNLTYAFNDEAQYLTYFADFGLVYAPSENISYGMVLRGLGHEVNYEIIETGDTILGSYSMQKSFELGATFRFPTVERTFMTLSFANEKRFGESGLWYKGGIELIPTPFLSLRGGVLFHLDNSVLLPRAGFGFNFTFGSFDYMISPKNRDGENFHQIGLTVRF